MAENPLILLLDEVRGKTLRLLKGVPDEQARWAPGGLQNSILWHAGHSLIVVEALSMGPLNRPNELPPGWFELFSWESKPAEVAPERWPTLAEVVAQLEAQQARLRDLIGAATPEALARPAGIDAARSVMGSIVHGLHDEACHGGEIILLKKLQGLPRMSP